MKKKYLLISLLLIAIGFATVSTTLLINGTSTINKNDSDFKVYYSDTYVNGKQDLSVIANDTNISFKTTLDTLGQTYVLDYDVTNSSKQYDAELTMNCTGGNEYISVTNVFDTEEDLLASETRRGKLTLTLAKSYSGDDLDVEIKCTIGANAVERTSIPTEEEPEEEPTEECTYEYFDMDSDGLLSIGDEYNLCEEKFNVIGVEEDNIRLLSAYSIGHDYKQTTGTSWNEYQIQFVDYYEECDDIGLICDSNYDEVYGWEYTPGPKEIDIKEWSPNINGYLTNYEKYINKLTKSNVTSDLITVKELGKLGCEIEANYSSMNYDCKSSEYVDWLLNTQDWWTKSADSSSQTNIGVVYSTDTIELEQGGIIRAAEGDYNYGVRPIISVSKEVLYNLTETPLDYAPQIFCQSVGYQFGEDYTGSGANYYDDGYYNCSNDDSDMVCYGEVYDETGNYLGPNDVCEQ